VLASGSGSGWHAVLSRNPILERRFNVDHRRWLVYRPGAALLVVDRVRSNRGHLYERYFHLGPDVGVTPQGSELVLSASSPSFGGRIRNAGSDGASLRLARAETNPLAGWTSPGFREKDPRWTASYRGRSEDADWVTSISLDQVLDTSATLDGKVTPNKVELDLDGSLPASHLRLQASNGSIAITQTP
jgi:hypothetical protein